MRHGAALLLTLVIGCGDSPGQQQPDASPDAALVTVGTASLVVDAVNYGSAGSGLLPLSPGIAVNTNNGAPDGAPSLGILSGPPLGMRVYLKGIALTRGAIETPLWSSTETHTTDSGIEVTGCELALTSGTIDLSGCPGLDQLAIPEGAYEGTSVIFARVGEIQGCLNGAFLNQTTSTNMAGTYTYPPPFPQTAFSYTTDAVTPGTVYTFCTRKDRHYFQAETASTTTIASNADLEATAPYFDDLTSPDFVAIDLGGGNMQAQTMAELQTSSISISTSVVPPAGDSTLTLVVDLNRMLELFANVRADLQPPLQTAHTGTSYFFASKLVPLGGGNATAAMKAFVGSVGTVEGYQWTATPTGGGPPELVAGWYTLFRDASGSYLGGTMYGDDIGVTILLGNAELTAGSLESGATLVMDVAGTCTGFTSTVLNGTGTCALVATGQGNGQTYDVAYTRLL